MYNCNVFLNLIFLALINILRTTGSSVQHSPSVYPTQIPRIPRQPSTNFHAKEEKTKKPNNKPPDPVSAPVQAPVEAPVTTPTLVSQPDPLPLPSPVELTPSLLPVSTSFSKSPSTAVNTKSEFVTGSSLDKNGWIGIFIVISVVLSCFVLFVFCYYDRRYKKEKENENENDEIGAWVTARDSRNNIDVNAKSIQKAESRIEPYDVPSSSNNTSSSVQPISSPPQKPPRAQADIDSVISDGESYGYNHTVDRSMNAETIQSYDDEPIYSKKNNDALLNVEDGQGRLY